MDIKLKITITLLALWFIFHFAAMPGSRFADWGEEKYGDYGRFLTIIAGVFLLPAAVMGIVCLWTML
jgi:uncharacterized membrane protein HdeD (DUF308 family)